MMENTTEMIIKKLANILGFKKIIAGWMLSAVAVKKIPEAIKWIQ